MTTAASMLTPNEEKKLVFLKAEMSGGSSSRSKSPAAIVRQRTPLTSAAAVTAVAEEGFDAYDRVAVSAQHEQMIADARAEMQQKLADKLDDSGGGGKVTVAFVEEMSEGRTFYDKFRIMSTSAAGLRPSQIELLKQHTDRILPMAFSGGVVFALIDQARYESRPLRCVDLSWRELLCKAFLILIALGVIGLNFANQLPFISE